MDIPILSGLALILAAAAALGLFALRVRRQKLLKGRARFIQQYAFPAELRNRLQRDTGLTLEQSGRVLEGLRQYFLVCLSARRSPIAKEVGMPSKAVDAAWHEFIVLTREYQHFCDRAFGRYLHHTPKALMSAPTSAALANTLHQFRQKPLTDANWAMLGAVPLLFAMDRELGFRDGHLYDEPAIHRLEAARQMQVASTAGSSGGDGGSPGNSGGDSGTAWTGVDALGGDGGSSCGGGGGCGGS